MIIINGQPITFGGSGSSTPAIFGDGSDGVGLFTANSTWNADVDDTGMIVRNFESLTISQGVTVAAGNRNCGMIIRVKGDCTIHGTLVNKMSPKTILDSDGVDFSAYPASMLTTIAGNGGAGGAGGGRIFVCHKGDISNTGTLNVNGGAVGSGYTAAKAGTIGTTAVKTYEQYMEEDVA